MRRPMLLGGDPAPLIGGRLDGSPLAILLDIDGTLAPIAPRPEDAAVPPRTSRFLSRLAATPNVAVALVTGRTVADALRMIDVEGTWIVGNHGLEVRRPSGEFEVNADGMRFERAVAQAKDRLQPVVSAVPGARIEDKRWSLSVHYRLVAPALASTVADAAVQVGTELALRITRGKKIVELRPPIAVDKGSAALLLADTLGARSSSASLLMAGDDITDEDAFRAVRTAMPRAVTVRVSGEDELPDLTTDAEFLVRSPDELSEVLGWLSDRRSGAPSA